MKRIMKFFTRPERLPIHIHQSYVPLSEFELLVVRIREAINKLISY